MTTLPTVVSARLPSYPQIAQFAKLQGTVVGVRTEGFVVASAEIAKSLPLPDASIKEDLRSWRFAPHGPTTFDVTYTVLVVDGIDPCADCAQRP